MNTSLQNQSGYINPIQQAFADVLYNNITNQKSLLATKSFRRNDVICFFSGGTVSSIPTYLTIQIGLNEHITLQPDFLQYTNHSCEPNVFFDTTSFELIALKDINVGDELTFFYPSSEWNMDQPFICNCGNKNCLHTIKGAAYLSKEVLSKYKLTNFIQSMIDKQ